MLSGKTGSGLLHPLRIDLRQFAIGLDLVDEGVDEGVDLLLAEPRAGAVVEFR